MPTERNDFADRENPVYGRSTIQYPGYNPDDLIVVEDVPIRPENYEPLPLGTPHPANLETGKDLRLVFQGSVQGTDAYKYVRRVYATPRTNQDVGNWAEHFSAESNAHPIYVRRYILPRLGYAPLAKGSTLSGVTAVNVTSQGSGYTDAAAVSFTGGGGTGAAAEAVVYEGKLAAIRVTAEGSGYTSAPTVSVTTGSAAVAVAFIQPASAVLVKEDAEEITDNPQLASLFLRVVRVYETLPGPFISDTEIDPDGIVVTVTKRRQLNSAIISEETLSSGVWTTTKQGPGDDFVSDEMIESRTVPGNPITTKGLAADGSLVITTKTLKAQSEITPGESIVGGNLVKVTQEDTPVFRGFALRSGDLVGWEVVEVSPLPGNILTSHPYDREMLVNYTETMQKVPAGAALGIPTAGAVEEIRAVDGSRSERIITTKTPAAVSQETAIITYRERPIQFPGRIDVRNIINGFILPFTEVKPIAEMTQVKIKTWFVNSPTTPVIDFDPIITGSPYLLTLGLPGTQNSYRSYAGILHDSIYQLYDIGGGIFYPMHYDATNPSYSDYEGVFYLTTGTHFVTNGSPNVVGTSTAYTTSLAVGDKVLNSFTVASITDNTHFALNANWTGPTGTLTFMRVQRASIAWVGSEKRRPATVTPTSQVNQWRVEQEFYTAL